jgi:hypothetical protein
LAPEGRLADSWFEGLDVFHKEIESSNGAWKVESVNEGFRRNISYCNYEGKYFFSK